MSNEARAFARAHSWKQIVLLLLLLVLGIQVAMLGWQVYRLTLAGKHLATLGRNPGTLLTPQGAVRLEAELGSMEGALRALRTQLGFLLQPTWLPWSAGRENLRLLPRWRKRVSIWLARDRTPVEACKTLQTHSRCKGPLATPRAKLCAKACSRRVPSSVWRKKRLPVRVQKLPRCGLAGCGRPCREPSMRYSATCRWAALPCGPQSQPRNCLAPMSLFTI